jgi:1,2-diacylglycerol 3-alpha-glucosyltransferase
MELKRKLLVVTDSFIPKWDGISRFLVDVLPSLANQFEVTLVCPKFKGEIKFDERIRIVRLPITRKNDSYHSKVKVKSLKGLVDWADVVFVNSLGKIGKSCINYTHKVKKPIIFYLHYFLWEMLSKNRFFGFFIKKYVLLRCKILFKKCSLLVVSSIHGAKKLDRLGIKIAKGVVKVGVDSEKFKPALNKENAKEFVGIEKNRKVIGFVGRLSKEKDLMTLYNAFKKLEMKHNNLFLLVVGKGDRKLEKLFKSEDNCRLIKSTNKIVNYLQVMDIFVMPSLAETSSIATLEAMSCGLPVVVSKTGDMVRYIKDKENGLFFSKRNSLLLSLKIEWLLKEDFVRKGLGLHARETVQNVFRKEDMIKNIRRILGGV